MRTSPAARRRWLPVDVRARSARALVRHLRLGLVRASTIYACEAVLATVRPSDQRRWAMFAKCNGVAALAIALVLAGADRVRGQGFRVLPNQPFVNNAAFFMNPGLAQARFLSGLQALQGQAAVNSFSNPF